MWARWDLNPRPRDYESPALTAELQAQIASNKRFENWHYVQYWLFYVRFRKQVKAMKILGKDM